MPKKLKVYVYKNCDTCRKALKFLEKESIPAESLPIRETPPSTAELKRMLGILEGDIRKLFNVSGRDYRALKLKDKLPGMSADEALTLLSSNGNLIKRPFALGFSTGAVGFREEEWRRKFSS